MEKCNSFKAGKKKKKSKMEDPELHAKTQLKLELEPQKDKTNKLEQTAF